MNLSAYNPLSLNWSNFFAGAYLDDPAKRDTRFGLLKVFLTVITGLSIGAWVSQKMAAFLEENELFGEAHHIISRLLNPTNLRIFFSRSFFNKVAFFYRDQKCRYNSLFSIENKIEGTPILKLAMVKRS